MDIGCLLDSAHNPVLVKAGAGDLGERRVLRFGATEQQLVVFLALPVDAENADMAGMVVAAGVDAARNLELQFAQPRGASALGKALRNLLRARNRLGIGKAEKVVP